MTATVFPGPAEAPQTIVVCDRTQTAAALDFHELVEAVAQAAGEYARGDIVSPERMVVPMGAAGGVLLSMPAVAHDIGIHKLVNVQPANAARQLPTIHGIVTVCDAATGRPLCLLDGPEVTGRRTAAVSLLAIKTLLPSAPTEVLLIGTGTQAAYHVHALHALHPGCTVWVRGSSRARADAFCHANRAAHDKLRACDAAQVPADVQVVITLTTATSPVYDEPARAGCLVIGVGAFKPEMAELGALTLDGSDIYADDPAGARHEAGDLLRAGVDWTRVGSLASALARKPEMKPPRSSLRVSLPPEGALSVFGRPGATDTGRPIVFKSVGTGAWDLAASRVALRHLASSPFGA